MILRSGSTTTGDPFQMHVFITGGTGLIGTRLIGRLSDRKDRVTLLSRNAASARAKFGSACEVVEGDPVQPGKWMDSIRDCDAVINLAGEGIFNHRWSTAFKAVLRDSRVKTTEHVVQALKQAPLTASGNSKILVNASAIGYYGSRGDEILDESSAPGEGFLPEVCVPGNAKRGILRALNWCAMPTCRRRRKRSNVRVPGVRAK